MSDPRISITADGADLSFFGGQPIMDDGLENLVFISLFTSPGWCGNKLQRNVIGSDFETECNKPITLKQLNVIRNAAELALNVPILGKVRVEVTNPVSHRLNVVVTIERIGVAINLLRDGGNWSYQINDPAHLRDGGRYKLNTSLVTFQGNDVSFSGGDVIW